MKRRIAVDTFMRTNRRWDDRPQYTDMNALTRVLSAEDFEAIYGWTMTEEEERSPRYRAELLMRKHPEKIIVLSRCEHGDIQRHRHHPDYNKPYEIEDLCINCHYARHKQQRVGVWGTWSRKQKKKNRSQPARAVATA